MRTASSLNLKPRTLLVAVLSACYPLSALAVVAGKVEFAVGNPVAVGPDGRSRPLVKGEDISTGDTIQTGNGRAQVRFTDGGFISLTPETEFKVNDYNYPGKADGTEKGFYGLIKGGLRAVTGAIGHVNKKTYLVNTPVATIGIRGTEFLATMTDKLIVRVGDGAVYLANKAGDIVLYKGQSGEVDDESSLPRYTPYEPLVNAAGPAWGTPVLFRQEARIDQPDQYTYVAGTDTTAAGIACELVGGCVTTSTASMTYLVSNNLIGEYSLVSSTQTTFGTNGFTANFGTGAISNFNLNIGFNSVSGLSGSISGSSFVVSGAASSIGTFDASGAFFGSNAAQAGLTYTFTSGGSGSATYQQTSLHP